MGKNIKYIKKEQKVKWHEWVVAILIVVVVSISIVEWLGYKLIGFAMFAVFLLVFWLIGKNTRADDDW